LKAKQSQLIEGSHCPPLLHCPLNVRGTRLHQIFLRTSRRRENGQGCFPTSCPAIFLLIAFCLLSGTVSIAQPRLAILDFNGESSASEHLQQLARQSEFTLVNPQQLNLAVKGAGYRGSLNLTLEEARGLGLSIGCDYYFIGMAKILRRLASEKEFYFDVLLGVFLVETRSGKLLRFSFEQAQAPDEAAANQQLTGLTEKIWQQSTDAIKLNAEQITVQEQQPEIYDLATDEATKLKIKPPQFYRRLKPAYTDRAELAGIIATIELRAIFQADGRIGAVEVIRWGGFGLDESAITTVKQLRFEPAKLNGRPVHVSAVVQYNFRKEEKAR
jgi:TonB family protein